MLQSGQRHATGARLSMPSLSVETIAVYVFRRAPEIELLQLHRADPGDAHPQTWQPVYGGVEAGETAPEAALRELAEETGLRPVRFFQVEFLETCYFRPRDRILMIPVFAAEVAADAPVVLDTEHDALRWVAPADVPASFLWRTQRDAIAVLLDQLERGGTAHERLRIALDP